MPVGLVCPGCNTPLTFHRGPVTDCPRCHRPLPDPLRQSAEAALARQESVRPLLLSIGAYASPGIGALFLLGVLGAATGTGSFDINGEPVSGAEFLKSFGVFMGGTGLLLVGIGVGLWRERTWARWLMVFYWVLTLGGTAEIGWMTGGSATALGGLVSMAPVALVAFWYLFFKGNVVAYYRALAAHEAAGGLTQRPDGGT